MSLWALALAIFVQSSNQTVPLPNPYGGSGIQRQSTTTRPRPSRVGLRPYVIGASPVEYRVEVAPPPEPNPLKNLVISPVYQREKINPKMIEIP
jgi:hypothetical protein